MKESICEALFAVCGICILGCSASRQDSSGYKAWIAVESVDSGVKIEAYCLNNTGKDAELRYELKAKKKGTAGQAQSSQAGPVRIAAGQEESLSRLGLSVSAGDRYQIDLKVYKGEKLVAEDLVTHPKGP